VPKLDELRADRLSDRARATPTQKLLMLDLIFA